MTNPQRYSGMPVPAGVSKSISRAMAQLQGQHSVALAQLRGDTDLALAQVEARAEIQAAKVDAVSLVTQRALQGVAFISQVEQQLAQLVPLAATRLQAIGDIGSLGLGQIVMDTANDLRRI